MFLGGVVVIVEVGGYEFVVNFRVSKKGCLYIVVGRDGGYSVVVCLVMVEGDVFVFVLVDDEYVGINYVVVCVYVDLWEGCRGVDLELDGIGVRWYCGWGYDDRVVDVVLVVYCRLVVGIVCGGRVVCCG